MKFPLRSALLLASFLLLLLYIYFGTYNSEQQLNEIDVPAKELVLLNRIVRINRSDRPLPRDLQQYSTSSHINSIRNGNITVVVVACGGRFNETIVMLKSATLLTKTPLRFIIFTEENLIPLFKEKFQSWPNNVQKKISYRVLSITFPVGNSEDWRKLFKPCASQRLFLPSVLPDVEAVLYVDTDVVFLTPLEDIWQHFHYMNSSQMAALSPEHEDYATGWYNRFARHPYYEPLGVNSGVMLMNLTRMRQFQWIDYVVPIYQEYKYKITWGDQDIINIIFHFHPDKLYIYPCRYNFRPDHCMYTCMCKSASDDGIVVLHGNREVFHNQKQPAFKAVYNAISEYEFNSDMWENLRTPILENLKKTESTNCGKIGHIFLKHLDKYFYRR